MRLKIAIVLAVLGLVVLGLGIGQRTIWLPPATLTAAVPADLAPAPLTVVGPELLKTREGQFTLTVKSEGPIQLAVARERDVSAWVGDAAHTNVGAPDAEHASLTAESVAGSETVPNPSGSDLWVSEEKATGEMIYTWQEPGRGGWALLLSSDGTAPAPTDISVTVDNEAGTPWAVPLMVIGSALLALAALLFLLAPRKREAVAAPGGRRAAGRGPGEPATQALEVDKTAPGRNDGKAGATPAGSVDAAALPRELKGNDPHGAGATSADTAPAAQDESGKTGSMGAGAAAVAGTPKNTATPENAATPEASGGLTGNAGKSEKSNGKPGGSDTSDESEESDKSDKSDGDASGPGGSAGADAPQNAKTPRAAKDKTTEDGSNPMTRLRWGAAVLAVLLAGGAGPAIAADETNSPSAPASSEASAAPEGTSATATGFPNLLDTQVQRIAESLDTVVASGDNAKNAKELAPRVAGMALSLRAANYQISAKVADHPAPEPVNAASLLAKAVSTTETWPRSAMFVSKGESNELPQLLTLVQESARENYKLTQATPLLPGQTFPSVDQEGTREVPLDSGEGLLMSPEAAIGALSDRLSKQDSKFKDSFKESVYTTSVFEFEKLLLENAKDADYVFSHKPDLKTAVSLRTADGGAIVVVGNSFGTDATSKEDANLTVGEDAAVFTGGRETTKGFTLNYAEPVVMFVPPAGGEKQITILSANRSLVGATFK
ncbi:hypothetical protein ACFUCV_05575 [Specibacter sp. NPDC057265]|uniref:hypothetical protein n=1 Tax=Specibacter sp. NPDC057265 TaxID=3346075 RepID=UPI00362EA2A1